MDNRQKEYLYMELSRILEQMDRYENEEARVQLEGLINEIKYDSL